ncbi:MAG TPA: hypothetical protein DCS23_00405 [Candidatus Yonathbacteria bacterium]|nr:hypothetical protein [Candidatus Yonathbacteria bacterium]
MNIADSRTFILSETILGENPVVRTNRMDTLVTDFIRAYKAEKFVYNTYLPNNEDASIIIALCVLEEKESWKSVASEIKKDGWSGASLMLWSLYVRDKIDVGNNTVTLPGTLYRDNNLIEWVPLVRQHPRMFAKMATEIVTMKLSSSLSTPKARIVLVSKIEERKT